jgi:hypothetical protein
MDKSRKMKLGRKIILIIIALNVSGCNTGINPSGIVNNDKSKTENIVNLTDKYQLSKAELAGLEQEFSFKTKALSISYVQRKLKKLTETFQGIKLVKFFDFARQKGTGISDLIKTVVNNNSEIYIALLTNPDIIAKISSDSTFQVFFSEVMQSGNNTPPTAISTTSDLLPLGNVGNKSGFSTGIQNGSVIYGSGGYSFTNESLFLKLIGGVYKVVNAAGVEPTMDVLNNVTTETIILSDFGYNDQGAIGDGASGFGGWVNHSGQSISFGGGQSAYWKDSGPGGKIDVSYALNFTQPVLQGPGETVFVSGSLYADDGWTINTKPGSWTGNPSIGTNSPSLSGDLSSNPDTDGIWTRVFSAGADLPNDPTGTRTNQAGNSTSFFYLAVPANSFSENMTMLVTGVDGSPYSWAGGGPSVSGLKAAGLTVTARTFTLSDTQNRFTLNNSGNIIDHFGAGFAGNYGHIGGSTQLGIAANNFYDYVPDSVSGFDMGSSPIPNASIALNPSGVVQDGDVLLINNEAVTVTGVSESVIIFTPPLSSPPVNGTTVFLTH